MATEIDIINGALALLKAPRINAITDNVENAALARLRFPVCRDAVLEMAAWHFANVRVPLEPSGTVPLALWSYQYPLPTQPWCIKIREPNPATTPWEVGYDPLGGGGRVLFSNEATMVVRYTAQITDCQIWSPLAVMALSYWLASELAGAVTGDPGKAKVWREAYLETIVEALASEATEGSPVIVPAPTALLAWR